ncbi:cobaltochelatase CobT-related protein [Swingsia samuiensis]|uniref:Cobaltochelatase subunit CobT n=1 Tax=Swingsia samuiensis TaxID=1293412 RepID=A0A4Y6UGP1_9PROT|nr:cobaltochelatase subunit CobT [Swingsia samuiensis]QDH16174.1 cobaltochelatase subunit CobT [Swingsia samuiensis]
MSAPKNSLTDEERQESFCRAVVATLRAIGDAPEQNIIIPGGAPGTHRKPIAESAIKLPHVSLLMHEFEIQRVRGEADSVALKLRYHQDALTPSFPETEAQATFNALEQVRCEVYGSRYMAGVRANLNRRLTQQMSDIGSNRMVEQQDMPISLALSLLTREALSGEPIPAQIGPALDVWRNSLPPAAKSAFAEMVQYQSDQIAFARAASRLLGALKLTDAIDDSEQTAPSDNNSDDKPSSDDAASVPEEDEKAPEGNDPEDENGDQTESGEGDIQGESETSSDILDSPENGTEEAAGPSDTSPDTASDHPDIASTYKAYTTEFDEEINAENLCDPEELSRLRQQLDIQLSQLQGLISRLAHRLQRRLLAQQQRKWEFEQEEGIIDAGRLARVVTNPTMPLSYKYETEMEFRDTVVTLLIDNSGSMRGRPIATAAICGDILARTLERCGVKVEVLGFTTRQWKGGQSREKWIRDGRPHFPGRLNDLRHIIYKDADTPWRRARRNLGLMLRDGLLKENIDGEALLWAWKRIRRRTEKRHILMVISDGAPVDDSTFSTNAHDYLEGHLRNVIHKIEMDRHTELLAIGIGHDVTRYYRNSVTISSSDDLGGTMIAQLSELFSPTKHKKA